MMQHNLQVSALTESNIKDAEVAKILKHLEKKGFDMDDDDIGPGP